MQELIFSTEGKTADISRYTDNGWRIAGVYPVSQIVSKGGAGYGELRGEWGAYVLLEK